MKPRAALRVEVLVLLWGLAAPAPAQEQPINIGTYHPLECLLAGELEARVYIYNRTDAEQAYKGEVADDHGALVLSGAWDLVLEEVKDGEVVSAKPVLPGNRPAGSQRTLKPGGSKEWKWRMPVGKLVGHPGNYRFRVSQGRYSHTGRLFRVVERRGKPDWVSLTYTPDKAAYFIGEPISVHFELRNHGADEFHFEEGGDYRGANRHLRWAFTAESEKGEKAVDPRPNQSCLGGMAMADPHVKPGKAYEKDLPLLAYLTFPSPGRYTVKAYQSMGFGEPVKGLDPQGHWGGYSYGGSFEVELRLPTAEETVGVLRSMLALEGYERRRQLATLHHPCYLEPLAELLANETDESRIKALVYAMSSIITAESTQRLLALAQDTRGAVRVAALRQLLWRLPDPKGEVAQDGRPRYYVPYPSPTTRLDDLRATWDDALKPKLRAILEKGLQSDILDEVSTCAYGLAILAATDAVELLAGAADRVAPEPVLAKANAKCANDMAQAAWLLARLGAKPCQADADSSPGRLALWANMVRTKEEYRTGDWEDVILHMMELECPVTRMAAIRWLPRGFAKRDRIPWKKLFLDGNRQIWWHALQVARQTFPPELKAIAEEILRETTDQSKQRDFKGLLNEIEARRQPK